MAWIEDPAREVLLVRQTAGLKLWTLPGGEVKRGESLIKVHKREVREETGLKVQVGSHLRLLDRRDKDAITLLRVRLHWSVKLRPADTRQDPADNPLPLLFLSPAIKRARIGV